ncbi:putative lipase [Danaus plexippus plexippus]|uniref:Lipase n=1 Tax=Danaus plexippus plexippus TaxID=278856 RepID=A0A212FKA5_DANPL|nr:putative lipase [Danaus plexippus plexippus]
MTLRIIKVLYFMAAINVYTSGVSRQLGRFSVSSLLDSLPVLQPIVQAGSNRCEGLKSYFGITYEQLLQKNTTKFDDISLDHITRNGKVKYNLNNTNNLKKIMRNTRNVIIIIHGYMESSDGLMVNRVAPEFLKKKYVGVFAMDGSNVFSYEYFRTSTYARFLGDKLGDLLSELIKKGVDPSKITLVGHSLGAHIAGVAGNKVKQNTNKLLRRITGLDPAGPCFSNVHLDGRLDKQDAEYVDVLHTNAGLLGLNLPVGHKDFYPNSGMYQPGCFLSTCDHSRAWEFYAESMNNSDNFPARKCENWTAFKNGMCTKNEIAYMGFNSEPGSPGSYFLSTASSSPYGLGASGSG